MERLPLFDQVFSKKIADDRLHAIAEAVAGRIEQEMDPGFLTGLAGEAVFLYQYGRFFASDRHENLGFLALGRSLAMIEKGYNWPSYATGLAGIRYALHYLASQRFIGEPEGAVLDSIDPYLRKFADARFREGDYDLLHGALGVYMTLPYHTATRSLTHNLSSLAVSPAPGQIAWPSHNPKTGTPEINLGVAHGLPSILVILSQHLIRKRSEPFDERSRSVRERNELFRTIEQGVNFLLSCEMNKSSNGSLFPHRMVEGKPDQPGRLAWCYGDAGIGAALWQVGANCDHEEWQTEAVRILRRAAVRVNTKANRIYDACLCHGTAGLALLFYKMAWLTGHEELLDASEHWMLATLDHGLNENAAGGYLYLTTGNRYISNYSLLEGISGTGLAILSLLEPEGFLGWEKGLLL
ncbi:MAG: lanthionine synthetase LanC family protein [Bacteroidota bacterium]